MPYFITLYAEHTIKQTAALASTVLNFLNRSHRPRISPLVVIEIQPPPRASYNWIIVRSPLFAISNWSVIIMSQLNFHVERSQRLMPTSQSRLCA